MPRDEHLEQKKINPQKSLDTTQLRADCGYVKNPDFLTDAEKKYILFGFNNLYHAGFYNERIIESMTTELTPRLVRSYAEILEDLNIQNEFLVLTEGATTNTIKNAINLEDYLDELEPQLETKSDSVFSLMNRHFYFKKDSPLYFIMTAFISMILFFISGFSYLWGKITLLAGYNVKNKNKDTEASLEKKEINLNNYNEEELVILKETFVYIPLPSLVDDIEGLGLEDSNI